MKSPNLTVTGKRSWPPSAEERNLESEWIPSDPLYTSEEWRTIKGAISPISTGLPFSQIANMLIVYVGNYRCAVIGERPEQITGFKFRSNENRKRLRKAIKALINAKKVFLSGKKAGRTEKKWLKTSAGILQEQSLRLGMLDINAALASNEKVNEILGWLNENETVLSAEIFANIIDLAIEVLVSQKNASSQSGRPKQEARKNLLNNLELIWREAKGISPSVNTDCETGMVTGKFHDFVHAIFKPISEQMNDIVDISALSEAIKKEIYRK